MNPGYAKAVVLLASVAMIAIRAPHWQKSRGVRVAESRKGTLEGVLLTLAGISFFLPLVWIATSALDFADYPLRPLPLALGTLLFAPGLWLFQRSHADLGTNWSITLELREDHRLVERGIYARVRHPMYLALLVYSAGQALVLPNRIAGPSCLVAMALIVGFRMVPEERMMSERFGKDWEAYRGRTRRLIPGVW